MGVGKGCGGRAKVQIGILPLVQNHMIKIKHFQTKECGLLVSVMHGGAGLKC